MSKGSILKRADIEEYGRGRIQIRRIAGRGFIAIRDVCFPGRTSNRPALRTQVRGAGETGWWTPCPIR